MSLLEVQPPALLVLAHACSAFAREVEPTAVVPAVGGSVQEALTELLGAWDDVDGQLAAASHAHAVSLIAASRLYAQLDQILVNGRRR